MTNFAITNKISYKERKPNQGYKAIDYVLPEEKTGFISLEVTAETPTDIYVVFDEIYEKLVYEGTHTNIATLGEDIKEKTIIVNGLAKAYAMTGWRIGYTACNAALAKAMGNLQSHATSNPNSIAQAAAVEALNGDQSSVKVMFDEYIKRRDYMVERISKIEGISCVSQMVLSMYLLT